MISALEPRYKIGYLSQIIIKIAGVVIVQNRRLMIIESEQEIFAGPIGQRQTGNYPPALQTGFAVFKQRARLMQIPDIKSYRKRVRYLVFDRIKIHGQVGRTGFGAGIH